MLTLLPDRHPLGRRLADGDHPGAAQTCGGCAHFRGLAACYLHRPPQPVPAATPACVRWRKPRTAYEQERP